MDLQVVKDGAVLHVIPLSEAPLYIGRAPENGLVVAEATVSANHAAVWTEGEKAWIKDLGSRNGTFVNDERIAAPTTVAPSDVIRLGPEMELRVSGSRSSQGPPQSYLLEDMTSQIRFPIRSDRFSIGGHPHDNLVIEGAEPQAITLLIYEDGELYIGGEDGEETPVKPLEPFEALGRRFRLLPISPTYTATIEAEPARYPYILRVNLDGVAGPEALLVQESTGATHRIDAENRAVLLYVLGKQWLDDRDAGVPRPEQGWCSDSDVSTGIWGKKGTGDANALHVLTHRLRKELKKAGFDPWFIETRRRALRLRVRDVIIT